MIRTISALGFAMLVAAGACSRSNGNHADTSLNTDLSLAAQQRGFVPLDSLSAAERAAQSNALAGAGSASRAGASRTTSTSATARRSSTGRTVHTSGGTVTSTQSSGRVVKHTQRDAAIGAAAGAVIGAATSKNKVKGGLIGAAVGGILGGVIGNNVDKKKKP